MDVKDTSQNIFFSSNSNVSCLQNSTKKHWTADSLLFPHKLYDAACSGKNLIIWNDEKNGVVMNEQEYEMKIMSTHPQLVIIPTFANIRRQFREYNFNWSYLPETNEFMFTHSCFVKDKPELLDLIVTRRKRARVNTLYPIGPTLYNHDKQTLAHRLFGRGPRHNYRVKSDKYYKPSVQCTSRLENTCPMVNGIKFNEIAHSPFLCAPPINNVADNYSFPTLRPVTAITSIYPKRLQSNARFILPAVKQKQRLDKMNTLASTDRITARDMLRWKVLSPYLAQHNIDAFTAHDISCMQYTGMQDHQSVADIPIYFVGDESNYNPAAGDCSVEALAKLYGYPIITIIPDYVRETIPVYD